MTAREHGLLCRDDMARAAAEDRKGVTRRTGARWAAVRPRDVLWVRECWAPGVDGGPPEYRADGPPERRPRSGRWRPSIFMPRAMARTLLRVGSSEWRDEDPLEAVDDLEARLEGFADAVAFRAAWLAMHPDRPRGVWRVAFVRVRPPDLLTEPRPCEWLRELVERVRVADVGEVVDWHGVDRGGVDWGAP